MSTDNRDFRLPWTKQISKQEWRTFLDFNFDNPSRPIVYQVIPEYLDGKTGIEFLEIGFGQCWDFENCFKALHDVGIIQYHGVDITDQFARYAKEEYPAYDFGVGGFTNIDKEYDVIYTSQTLEHQHPEEYEQSLRNVLDHARHLCVIVWFQSPRKDGYFHWSDVDGFGGEGAWVNRYDIDAVDRIIRDAGFTYNIQTANSDRSVYICERVVK